MQSLATIDNNFKPLQVSSPFQMFAGFLATPLEKINDKKIKKNLLNFPQWEIPFNVNVYNAKTFVNLFGKHD